MNHRQRVVTAIQHKIPDRIPVDAICIENCEAIGVFLDAPVSEVYERLDIDGRCVAAGRYTVELPVRNGKTLSHWGTDDEGDYRLNRFCPLAGASVSDIERYAWPDAGCFDFAELSASLVDWTGEYALRGPYWISAPLFCTVCNLMGMEDTLCNMLAAPSVFEACVDQVFRFSTSYIEHFIAAAGPKLDILYLADDFASQRGLLMDPELWRGMLKPRYEKLFAIGKRHGLPIWFHSCGDVTEVLPDLIDIGMDVWETVQLHALPVSAVELKMEYGRHLSFFGGVNTQSLPFKTPDEVADEVRRAIEILGKDGGYICGPDHHIKPDVSAENTVMLFETARSFKKPGYTR